MHHNILLQVDGRYYYKVVNKYKKKESFLHHVVKFDVNATNSFGLI